MPPPQPVQHPAAVTWLTAWLPVLAWGALIFVVSAQSDLRILPVDDPLEFLVRKVGHFAVFGILAVLLWQAFRSTTGVRRPMAWSLALTVLYAVSDELHQGTVAGRHASAGDVLIDSAGALAFLVGLRAVRARRDARSSGRNSV